MTVHRVVPDPRPPLGDLAALVEQPEDLEELLAVRALTDPVAADAFDANTTVPRSARYVGPGAASVMGPFLRLGVSRFSPGTYGVLYTADALRVAVSESAYHVARLLAATYLTAPTTVPRYATQLDLDASGHVDVRRGGADDIKDERIYDPLDCSVAQSIGNRLRAAGRDGVMYDSIRASRGTCYGTFRPSAVQRVNATTTVLELVWDGSRITEYREIITCALDP